MGDVTDLLEAFDEGSLLRPSTDKLNLVDLSRAVARWAGVAGLSATPGEARVSALIGQTQHLVLLLADGLGVNVLGLLPEEAFLRTHVATPLRTVFPSTTAVALTSLATAQWPSRHAIVGWWTHLQELGAAATIVQFVSRAERRPLAELGISPQQAFPMASAMAQFTRDTLALFPERIADGRFTAYFCGGRAVRGYRSLSEAVEIALERVRLAESPTFTYIYTNRVDDTAHAYGLVRPEVRTALYDLNRWAEHLAEGLAGRGRLLLTADHGFLDSGEGRRHEIRFYDDLLPLLRYAPSGDARAMYLHARPGARGRIRDYFFRRFGDRFLVITSEEAEELGLFGVGPLSDIARARIGDVVVISRGPDALEYRPAGGNGKVMLEAAEHSGLTPEEMVIPLVVV